MTGMEVAKPIPSASQQFPCTRPDGRWGRPQDPPAGDRSQTERMSGSRAKLRAMPGVKGTRQGASWGACWGAS